MLVTQRPDIIDHDRTIYGNGAKFGTGGEMASTVNFSFRKLRDKKLRPTEEGTPLINFKEPGYEGRHLWRGTAGPEWVRQKIVTAEGPKKGVLIHIETLTMAYFCSDEFAEWYLSEGIRGNKLMKVIEKPVEWYYDQRDKGLYN